MKLRLVAPGEAPGPEADEVAVCPDELTELSFRRAGRRSVLADGNVWALPGSAGVRLHCQALAREWYRGLDGEDFTVAHGLSLGAALEGVTWSVTFAPIFDLLHRLRAAAREHAAASISASADVPSWRRGVAAAVGAALAIPGPGSPDESGSLAAPPASAAAWPLSSHRFARRWADGLLGVGGGDRRWLVSYYYTLEPLLDAISARPELAPAFYGWPGRRWVRLRRWWRWRCPVAEPASVGQERELAELQLRWRTNRNASAYRDRFVFSGVSVWPQVRAALDAIVEHDFPLILREASRVRRMLDDIRPEKVVVPFDASPPERLLLHECRRRGIPTALVLHGAPTLPRNPLMDTQADLLLVGGRAYVDEYASVGVPRDRIRAVGHPLLDRCRAARRSEPARRPRVVVISTLLPVERNIGRVLDLLAPLGADVTVKLHPGEDETAYRRLLEGRLGPAARLVLHEDFVETASRADLVIGAASTALLEAMAMGVPVLLTNFEGSEVAAPFDGKWGIVPHGSLANLDDSLRRWLPGRLPRSVDYSATLEAFFGPADGRAGERILAALGA